MNPSFFTPLTVLLLLELGSEGWGILLVKQEILTVEIKYASFKMLFIMILNVTK